MLGTFLFSNTIQSLSEVAVEESLPIGRSAQEQDRVLFI